jgi:DNA repair protein RadA/Sms
MVKVKTIYTCQSCAHTVPKWLGRCPGCGAWDTFLEEKISRGPKSAYAGADAGRPMPISALDISEDARVMTGIAELDRVLGGGIVPGSTILIGGDPGIGKSTLMLQAMGSFARAGHRVLYVSGEESARQIRLRAERLGAISDELLVFAETSVERIIEEAARMKPDVLVIDSVQTMQSAEIESSPGSLSQVRDSAARLIGYAKSAEVPLFLVGHVTKEGNIAGPKTLEHMVDTVLYFEGERGHQFRILRAAKNRFGSVMEIGIFEMGPAGLAEVLNPSEIFLAERPEGASGSAVVSSLEGTRTILVEVQSLVCPTAFGIARRTVVGVDYNRVMLLAAVLEKKAGITLASHDIYIKVAGGIRLDEPAVDLGVIASISSNFFDKAIEPRTVIFGEVGLAGEVRGVHQAQPRIMEAAKLGFKSCILPKDNLKGLKKSIPMELVGVATIKEAIERFF